MLERLQYVKQRFDEVSDLIIQPDVIADQKRYVQLNKEYKDLKALVEKREEYINVVGNIQEAKEIIADGSDAEMVEMAKMQLDEAQDRLPQLEEEIKFMLIPKDPEDAKNVMVEIRAGTGGDEASIFAGDLFKMYTRYCESRGWRTSVVDLNEGKAGGYKEIIFNDDERNTVNITDDIWTAGAALGADFYFYGYMEYIVFRMFKVDKSEALRFVFAIMKCTYSFTALQRHNGVIYSFRCINQTFVLEIF